MTVLILLKALQQSLWQVQSDSFQWTISVWGQCHHTALYVLRPFLPSSLLQKQPKCPYPNTKDTPCLQIISLGNNTENISQAATKSLLQTSSVGKMVLSTGEGRGGGDRDDTWLQGSSKDTWNFRGEWGVLGSVWRRIRRKGNLFLSFPQSMYFLTDHVIQDIQSCI